jgi:hypothetical protein
VHPVALLVPQAEDSTEACSSNSPNLPKCNNSDRSAKILLSVITADVQMVQENPALIQPLMQQIATSNPQLAQLINQNPQALYDLLGAGAPGEGEGEDDFLGPQVMHVDLTEADAAAVERVRVLFLLLLSTPLTIMSQYLPPFPISPSIPSLLPSSRVWG